MKPISFSPDSRFWYKVYQRGDCWEWRGSRHRKGQQKDYGHFGVADGEFVAAHRFAYDAAKGLIMPGLEVNHICAHRWCVKPSHLEAITRYENYMDYLRKRRFCKYGHEYTPENTRRHGKNMRCRTCANATCRASYRRKMERLSARQSP